MTEIMRFTSSGRTEAACAGLPIRGRADAHSAWSPDGEWIAFSTSREGFKDEALLHPGNFQAYGEICVMRKDGSDVRILTDNATEEGAVSWIPSLSK